MSNQHHLKTALFVSTESSVEDTAAVIKSTGDKRMYVVGLGPGVMTDLPVGRNVESLAKNVLLHLWAPVLVALLRAALVEHFFFWPDIHRDFQERLVQEGNARFETPGHSGSFGGLSELNGEGGDHVEPQQQHKTYLLARRQSAVCRFFTRRTHSW
jgi:hypothetical protein